MMGVYIKGMEMPDCGYVCLKVFANGDVMMNKVHRGALVITGIKDKVGTAVSVPPHGALIDRDDFFAQCPELVNGYKAITDDLVVIPAEEKGENFCADCHWYEAEEMYCFRKGCHSYDESSCELWEPMPADEPIPAPGGKTVPTTYDLLYEEGGAGTT